MKVLAIIPARGGSKGVINKNIREVAGKPLIAYSIDCVKSSKKVSRYIVSTDSKEIAKVAESFGAEVNIRPKNLAEDDTPVVEVVNFLIEEIANKEYQEYDLILLLQPTSPIRLGSDLDNVVKMFEEDNSLEGVVSVVPMQDTHPARMYELDEFGWMKSLMRNGESIQRQNLEPVYYRNGAIYAVKTAAFKKHYSLMVPNKKAYIMPLEWLVNIDDERDLLIANVLVKLWKESVLKDVDFKH